ncbi:MAG: nitroreductase family protein [Clostridia bacterium]|nr:nitroreductase family protein [Clostridia bacterium]
MNEVIKNILSRRSVRNFTSKKVSDEIIETLLQAATYAPSAKNGQPWFFSVVQNKEILNKIDDVVECLRGGSIFYGAQTVIFVAVQDDTRWGLCDCAAATQNILLAAHSLGLGTCWIGCCRDELQGENAEEYKKLMGIPDGYTLSHAIAIGYSDETSSIPSRKDDVFSFIV